MSVSRRAGLLALCAAALTIPGPQRVRAQEGTLEGVVLAASDRSPVGGVLVVLEGGKRTKGKEYRTQARGGQGLINIKASARNGDVVGIAAVDDTDEVMLITSSGKIIRMEVSGISVIGRNTQGVKLLDVGEGDKAVAIAKLAEKEEGEAEPGQPE